MSMCLTAQSRPRRPRPVRRMIPVRRVGTSSYFTYSLPTSARLTTGVEPLKVRSQEVDEDAVETPVQKCCDTEQHDDPADDGEQLQRRWRGTEDRRPEELDHAGRGVEFDDRAENTFGNEL